jgi:Ricin-type beta-trefoil lectin domain-like
VFAPYDCVMFRNYYSNKCLDVYQDRNGNKIVQWPCNPDDLAQVWIVEPSSDDGGPPWYNICSVGAGGALTDPNNSATKGQQLYEENVNFEIGQSWDSTLLFSTGSPLVCE